MRPIGFSTGALAQGDFLRGLDLQRNVSGIDAVELSALREHELPPLVAAIPALDLDAFAHVSFHAPGSFRELTESKVFDLLMALPETWPIVVHPEILRTPSIWRRLGRRLCLENMDNRKPTGRTVAEMRALFVTYPDATFCLDLGHVHQIDPTMITAILMLREFGDRLRQVHVSDVGPRGNHLPLGATVRYAFAGIVDVLPRECPMIIESIITSDRIARELETVTAAFASVEAHAAIA